MRRRGILAALAVSVAAMLLWYLRQQYDIAPPPGEPPTEATRATAGNTIPPTTGNVPAATGSRESEVAPPDPNAATKGLQLRVRLRGLHPQAPWTTPLELTLHALDPGSEQPRQFEAAAAPDATGLATFTVPDWCGSRTSLEGRVGADDPHYREVEHEWTEAFDPAAERTIDVQAVALVQGRIVDVAGTPVPNARIALFALGDGGPIDGTLTATSSNGSGTFHLDAPPSRSLFLLVTPMQSVNPLSQVGEWRRDGALRTDLLPTSLTIRTAIGNPTPVGDIVVLAAAIIAGSVRWADGTSIPLATVQTWPREGTTLRVDQHAIVQRHADGRLSPGTTIDTDDDGTFALPALPGAELDVALLAVPTVRVIGQFAQAVTPPRRVDFVLPAPITLRATDGSQPIAHARIEIGNGLRLQADATGTAAVVAAQPLRARALHGRLHSPWLDVPMNAAGTTVDLVMSNARVLLAIEFQGDFRVRNTVVHWRRDDGLEGREHLLRDDNSGPFELFLEPGGYHVTAGPGGGERNGVFLLPVERDVDLTAGPQTLTLTALFGGSFSVMATDGSGVWVSGTCRLLDRTGQEFTDRFRVDDGGQRREGLPGELLGGSTNTFTRILPPGDYELLCDFGANGARREVVHIKPREFTEVRIRLP